MWRGLLFAATLTFVACNTDNMEGGLVACCCDADQIWWLRVDSVVGVLVVALLGFRYYKTNMVGRVFST